MPEDKGLTRSQREEKILQFWKEKEIFKKSLEKKPEGLFGSPKEFTFYEGPPGANGRPGVHHMESRFFKDAVPRYKTMRGFRVPRQAGWDTHGLPVELEAEKILGIKSKKEIEEFGIGKFNAKCREIVWKYVDEWEKLSDRIGFWLDFKNAYVTYHNSFIESVWKIMSHVEKRKLLYKDYKVVPWCPRCGTALSSHELALGYQDVKDLSLYVKFKVVGQENTYLVAWTTTPWTLPGNVALAVGKDIRYAKYNWSGENLIIAKDRASKWPGHIQEEFLGKDLVGLQYEPLYKFITPNEKSFKVYAADFVNTEDGTGIVHTAVMYGQDDFELGTKVGLPKQHLVSPDGTFVKETDWLAGKSVVEQETVIEILKDLQNRGLLFDKENHAHSYPFCWRCKTRLIYYARDSWYIKMSALREDLLKENEKIRWEPEHIKDGRFGEWLKEVKDWAISRERYWGTPLPVWESGDDRIVVDSIDTLKKYSKTNGNRYFLVRHGQADHNVLDVCSSDPKNPHHITELGKEHVLAAAKKLKKEKVDLIIRSPFIRAQETAEIIAQQIGFPSEKIEVDDRIGEFNFGDFNLKPFSEYLEYRKGHELDMHFKLPNGETLQDAKNRFGRFLYEIDGRYSGKNIVVVTHGIGFEAVAAITDCADEEKSADLMRRSFRQIPDGFVEPFSLARLPHNDNFELDLHKPFVDDVVLVKDGKEYRRVKEVMDVWFDSGAMPFATDSKFPADFISEGVDQTRGWFYTLHAIGALMGKGRAFKNVICLGLILDKEGKKMSKSVGNVVDPWTMIEKYGVDVLRLWMYSVNQPGDNKNFDERSVDEINKRIFNLLDNVYTFYELYNEGPQPTTRNFQPKNILDRWILMRLSGLTKEMTDDLKAYKLLEPVRAIREFIDDLSTWYLRRSRERLKDGDKEAKETFSHVLKTLSKLLAPFAPFAAEELYQKLRNEKDPESVHLEHWPEAKGRLDKDVIDHMRKVRDLVSLALEARQRANIKIRQPLQKLAVKSLQLTDEYIQLIKDEVNVKEVVENKNLAEEILLDTNLTPELIEEGEVREIIRGIQEMRKERNLNPKDTMKYEIPEGERALFNKFGADIKRVTNIVTE